MISHSKTLHETVSKAFCINLYYRPERWTAAAQQFAAAGLNVERFNAMDGNEFKKKYALRPGNCGCNLSHFMIIQEAYIKGLDAIMVFEDDPVFRDDFMNAINPCLQDLPGDWDLVMLGGSHKQKPTPVTENIYRVNKSFCSHAYIIRHTVYEYVLERLKLFDQPLDCIFTELQEQNNVYITNPPMVWQTLGFSDIENKVMNYDWLKSNEQ